MGLISTSYRSAYFVLYLTREKQFVIIIPVCLYFIFAWIKT